MKKYFSIGLLSLIIIAGLSSCFHHHDISISISDDEDEYEMDALYNRSQEHKVQVYLNEHLLNKSSKSFKKHKNRSEEITLDDNTTVYIKSYPGELRIKIDKYRNSEESCENVRQICEDLKDILADN